MVDGDKLEVGGSLGPVLGDARSDGAAAAVTDALPVGTGVGVPEAAGVQATRHTTAKTTAGTRQRARTQGDAGSDRSMSAPGWRLWPAYHRCGVGKRQGPDGTSGYDGGRVRP